MRPINALWALCALAMGGCIRDNIGTSPVGTSAAEEAARTAGDTLALPDVWPADSTAEGVRIFAEPAVLPAGNSSQSTVTVLVYDANRNPVPGAMVRFASTAGVISKEDSTDAEGRATAVYTAAPFNGDVRVLGAVGQGDSPLLVSTILRQTGLRVQVEPLHTEALVDESVPVTVRVLDALGEPVPGAAVTLEGADRDRDTTGGDGSLVIAATRDTQGRRTVRASALGATDSAVIDFFTVVPTGSSDSVPEVASMRIFAAPSVLKASNTDIATVTVRAFGEGNNPLAGRVVRFSANRGTVSPLGTTDENGEAHARYQAVPINGTARVAATMSIGDTVLSVETLLTLEDLAIALSVPRQNALLNDEVPVSVSVTDGAGAPVPAALVEFSGAPVASGTTDAGGLLATTLTRTAPGRATLTARSLGAEAVVSVDFWEVLPDTGKTVNAIRKMRIFSSRSQLRADNSDFARITVILTNEENNPATGDEVRFSSDLGIIDGSARVDSTGRAVATLRASPVNGTATVHAVAVGRNLEAVTQVLFSGVTLQLTPDKTELKIDEMTRVEALLTDASGNPLGGDEVFFSLSGAGGSFENGLNKDTVTLDPNGRAAVRVTSSNSGIMAVSASALNTNKEITLGFSNNTLSLQAADGTLTVGGGESTAITATYVDGSNNPISGAVIAFGTSAGSLSAAQATTNGSGVASVTLSSADFAGPATVQADAANGSAQIEVQFLASSAAKVVLSLSPDNIRVNGGITDLAARVTDGNENVVTGADVNFRILQGPGGGETIAKPVVTSQNGIAVSQLQAGDQPSQYQAVEVEASVGGIADTAKLTISGFPHTITVSRPEDDTVVVPDAGQRDPSVFEYNVGAVVKDVNGNDVADGTEVHFSSVVTGLAVARIVFVKWKGIGSSFEDIEPIFAYRLFDVPFEDINDNVTMDPGVDLKLDGNDAVARRGEDVNGDGSFDWDPAIHDYFFDFNGNGLCDAGVGEDDTLVVPVENTSGVGPDTSFVTLFLDKNNNGIRDRSELLVDRGAPGCGDQPASGDYPYSTWEARPFIPITDFTDNEFAVVISTSATTLKGVAETKLIYPRQFSRRLYVTVNAEANGIHDKDGERFVLPQIVGQ